MRGDKGSLEFLYRRADGSTFPAEFRPGVLKNKEGETRYFAVVRDLSEIKKHEEKLKESEEMFRRIAETSIDGIYQLDLQGTVIYCSPAVEKMLGYTPEEFVGSNFRVHVPPEDRDQAEDLFIRGLREEEIRQVELKLLRKDGGTICVQINATPVREDGKVVGSQGIARDITVAKQAEDALRSSEARLRTVIDSIPFDFFFIDETGRYAMLNKSLTESWGDVIGKRPEEIGADPATLALWLENNRRAFAGQKVEEEVTFKVKGEDRYFYNILSPVRDAGEVKGIIGVNVDITERKCAEMALRESEEKYRFLVENTGAVVSLWNPAGELMLVNRMGADYLGRNPEALVGKAITELIGESPGEKSLAEFRKVMASGVGAELETAIELPIGKRWFRLFVQPVRDAHGRIFGLQVVAHDITELMRAERSLRERDARLRLMVSQLPAVVWTIDRDLRFTSSAGAGLRLLHLEPGQVIGKTLYEYFNTDDPEFLPIAMHRRALGGEPAKYEFPWEGGIWETHIEALRDEAGGIIGCLAIATDITLRKQAEQELQSSKEALSALAKRLQRVREEESKSIAREIHDTLGQALTGIKFGLAFIRRRLPSHEDATARAEIEEKIEELVGEIDDTIHTVRKISAQLRPQILDDLNIMEAIEWQAQDFGRKSGIPCTVNSYCAGAVIDPARATAIFRIFQEILTNIQRHSEAKHVWVDLTCEEGEFVLDVRDDGKGIERSRLRRLEGLGILGMRERALAFGGHVEIGSDAGKGTSVKVTVPLNETS